MNKNLLSKKILHSQGGFTLLEVIIAISILTIGLLAVGAMQLSAIWGNSFAGRMTAGTAIAENKLEELLSQEFELGSVPDDLTEGDHGTGETDESGYETKWTVSYPFTETTAIRSITVTVTWKDQWRTRSTSVSSYLARS